MQLSDHYEDLPSSNIDPPAKLDWAIWDSFEPYLFDYLKNHFNASTPICPQAVIWDDWEGENRQSPWLSITRDVAPLAKEKGWTLLGKYDHHRDFPGLSRVIKSYASKYIGEYDCSYQLKELKSAIEHQKKTNPNTRVVGVLFTGGTDSTALVLDNLERGNIVIPIYNRINIKYATYHLIAFSAYSELKHRAPNPQNLMPIWKGLALDGDTLFGYSHCFEGFIQQPYNMFSLAYIAPDLTNLIDEFQIGIVSGDQSVPFTKQMNWAYQNMFALSHLFDVKGAGKDSEVTHRPVLTFPLVGKPKKTVFDILKKYEMDWIPLSCENPDISVTVYGKVSEEELVNILNKPLDPLPRGSEVRKLDFPIGLHIGISDCHMCHSCERSHEKEDFRGPRTIHLQVMEKTPDQAFPALVDLAKAVSQPGGSVVKSYAFRKDVPIEGCTLLP